MGKLIIPRRRILQGAIAAPFILKAREVEAAYCGQYTQTPPATNQAPPAAQAAGFNNLIFYDDFTSMNSIDLTGNGAASDFKWFCQNGNGASNISQSGSSIKFSFPVGATFGLQTCNNANQASFAEQYFYAEASIAWDPVNNSWPQWWCFCLEHNQGTDGGQGMELDIFEGGGAQSNSTNIGGLTTLHTTASGAPCLNCNSNGFNFAANPQNYNTYAALWTAGEVKWYLNNTQINSFSYNEPYWDGANNHEFLVLAGNEWNGSSAPAWTMSIDWVKVWRT